MTMKANEPAVLTPEPISRRLGATLAFHGRYAWNFVRTHL